MQLNEGREKPAGLIAGLLNKIGFPPRGRPATATAVLYWRQKFRGELDFEVNRDFFRAMAWSDAAVASTIMLLRDSDTGELRAYNIDSNQITGSAVIGKGA
jgi:hypothetical protein